MDFSNVNQSEKQAENEMVWKMQVPHTHAHVSRSQFSFGAAEVENFTLKQLL